jgi:hypothetical protein
LWKTPDQPARYIRIVLWMSSVTDSVATPPIERSASTRTSAPVPHQKGADHRFFAGAMTR